MRRSAQLIAVLAMLWFVTISSSEPNANFFRNPFPMTHSQWSGGFIDEHDFHAVERWARGMCRGLSVEEAARQFETESTIEAIADELAQGLPAKTYEAVRLGCKAELRG